jgi:hypothetical protein
MLHFFYETISENESIMPKRTTYEIKADVIPVERGGFKVGAQLTSTELEEMLKYGGISAGVLLLDVSSEKEFLVVKTNRRRKLQLEEQ